MIGSPFYRPPTLLILFDLTSVSFLGLIMLVLHLLLTPDNAGRTGVLD